MIDLLLWAPAGRVDLVDFAKAHPPGAPLWRQKPDGTFGPREGLDYCFWAGSGQFMTVTGEYDENGDVITPPTFLPGVVALLRIYGSFFDSDNLAESGEQWARSKVARYIKDNGTPGTMAAGLIAYYELDGVRFFRAVDVFGWLAARGLPGHEWLGGNSI